MCVLMQCLPFVSVLKQLGGEERDALVRVVGKQQFFPFVGSEPVSSLLCVI